MVVNGRRRRALVDTGSTYMLISAQAAVGLARRNDCVLLEMMDGGRMKSLGSVLARSIVVNGMELGPWPAQVMRVLPMNVEVILGLDVVLEFGLLVNCANDKVMIKIGEAKQNEGVLKCATQRVMMAQSTGGDAVNERTTQGVGVIENSDSVAPAAAAENQQAIEVTDDDFRDDDFEWRWVDGKSPAFCSKPNYAIPEKDRAAFVAEVEDWIGTGVLVQWDEREHGRVRNFLPLMSVNQSKGEESKVRPVIDFRVLNEKVLCLTSDMLTCDERLREWRAKGCDGSLVDLRWAYLQVHMA